MTDFFTKITDQFANKLPFVAYRKPNESSVNALFQTDSTINYVNDYSESGFVFAPFDSKEKSILIPFDNCLSTIYVKDESITNTEDVELNFSDKQSYEGLVNNAISTIQQTDLKKVVLSRVEENVVNKTCPIILFKRAMSHYQNAFVYVWYHPEIGCWLGATPEVLLTTRNNQFKTMALAGTQLFSNNVVWKNKEIEEQQIVTDYIVESLKNRHITPNLSDSYTLKAGHLAHIRTDITGSFGRANLGDIISVLHPTPAVCGFPKQESKAFVLQNELYDRTFYTGFLGELNKTSQRHKNRRNTENFAYRITTKSSDLYVNLRCMELRNDTVKIYVGGGITASSNPEKEFIETCNKTKTMKKLIIS